MKLAGCIIKDKRGRILLLHRNTADWQHWEIPGGKIETGEKAEETAVRETKEEVCVDVEIIRLLGRQTFKEKDYKLDYAWYEAKIVNGKVEAGEPEIFDEVKYFAVGEMDKVTLSSGAKTFLGMVKAGKVNLHNI